MLTASQYFKENETDKHFYVSDMVWGCHFQSLSEAASFSRKKNELFHGMIYKQFICSLVDENLDCYQLGAIMNKDVIKILGLKKKGKEATSIFAFGSLYPSSATPASCCLSKLYMSMQEGPSPISGLTVTSERTDEVGVEPFHPQKPHPTGWKTWAPSSFHTLYNL